MLESVKLVFSLYNIFISVMFASFDPVKSVPRRSVPVNEPINSTSCAIVPFRLLFLSFSGLIRTFLEFVKFVFLTSVWLKPRVNVTPSHIVPYKLLFLILWIFMMAFLLPLKFVNFISTFSKFPIKFTISYFIFLYRFQIK